MQVTDEMLAAYKMAHRAVVDAALKDYSKIATIADDARRAGIKAALTAALSDKQAVEVKIKPLEWIEHPSADAWRADTMLGTYQVWAGSLKTGWLFDGLFAERLNETSYDEDAAKAAAQADYEQRIRSALVDVPAVEPVAYLRLESRTDIDGETYTGPQMSDVSDERAFPVYASPPLSREGEDGAEVERKFKLGDRVTKTKGSSWQGHVVGFYSTALTPVGYAVESEREPGSVQIYPESALAATRSGSATGQKGGDHG